MNPLYLDYDGIKNKLGVDIADAFADMQKIFTDGIVDWFAGLWDDRIGGFYYSKSARDHEGFLPDVESTAQALGNLTDAGMFDGIAVPFDMRNKAASFVRGLQDPDDGFFYHPQWGKNIGNSRRGRDLYNSLGLLKDAGEEPLYKSALERIESDSKKTDEEKENTTIPEHLRSKEAFLAYLEGLGINKNSYPAGHKIGAEQPLITAAGLTDVAIDFLNSHQYENGLWEKELNYASSNGLMKISAAYRGFKRRMPMLMKAFESSLEIAISDLPLDGEGITSTYNTFYTIDNVFTALKETGDEELIAAANKKLLERAPELIRMTAKKLSAYLRPDGSFSYCTHQSCITSQGAVASLGAYEGDVNATVIAIGTRRRLGLFLGADNFQKIYTEEHTKSFCEIVEKNLGRSKPKAKRLIPANRYEISKNCGSDIADVTSSLHHLFTDKTAHWLFDMYSHNGGFCYSRSAKEKSGPDLVSTQKALECIKMLGIVDNYADLPEKFKNDVVTFARSCRTMDSYLYNKSADKNVTHERLLGDQHAADYILSVFSVEDGYPLSDKGKCKVPSGFKSVPECPTYEDIAELRKEIELCNGAQVMRPDLVYLLSAVMRRAFINNATPLLQNVENFIMLMSGISENAEKYATDDVKAAVAVKLYENRRLILKIVKDKLGVFYKEDFSYMENCDCAPAVFCGAALAEGVIEGNMNALHLALKIKEAALSLTGVAVKGCVSDALRTELLEGLTK